MAIQLAMTVSCRLLLKSLNQEDGSRLDLSRSSNDSTCAFWLVDCGGDACGEGTGRSSDTVAVLSWSLTRQSHSRLQVTAERSIGPELQRVPSCWPFCVAAMDQDTGSTVIARLARSPESAVLVPLLLVVSLLIASIATSSVT